VVDDALLLTHDFKVSLHDDEKVAIRWQAGGQGRKRERDKRRKGEKEHPI
jgi:hypothetical protein